MGPNERPLEKTEGTAWAGQALFSRDSSYQALRQKGSHISFQPTTWTKPAKLWQAGPGGLALGSDNADFPGGRHCKQTAASKVPFPTHVLDSAYTMSSACTFQSLSVAHLLTSQLWNAAFNPMLLESSVRKAGMPGVGAWLSGRKPCDVKREAPWESMGSSQGPPVATPGHLVRCLLGVPLDPDPRVPLTPIWCLLNGAHLVLANSSGALAFSLLS